jgi:hypothetical protein
VKVSPDVRWEDRPELEDLMVFAWAPCNAGVAKNGLYAFLGLLPPPTKGESDITELYLKKLKEWRKLKHKRYHIPLEEGVTKVFIKYGEVTGCVKKSVEPLPCGRSRFFKVGFAA